MRARKQLLRTYVTATLLAFSVATAAAGQTSGSGETLSNIRIGNFGRINANYYRGAQPTEHDFADLAALGVKTVIDLTKDGDALEPQVVRSLGMTFYRIPMTTRVAPSVDQLAQFLRLVTDPVNQPVYVHCQGGRHRTGVMTAVYRMTADGWTAAQAFAEMKQYQFGADFLHPEFKRFVYAYRLEPAPATPSPALVAADAAK